MGQEIDEDVVYRVARSLAQFVSAKSVVIGFDARKTSKKFAEMVINGVNDVGADKLIIGLVVLKKCIVLLMNLMPVQV